MRPGPSPSILFEMNASNGARKTMPPIPGRPTPFDRLDLYSLKTGLERVNEVLDLTRATADLRFLLHARRELLPLPLVDRTKPADASTVFERFRSRPARGLQGKRIGVLCSGGGGACIASVGAARALEEAGVEPALITGCSGGAIWGSMWASGMSAHQMAEFSLSWRAEDYLDIQWARLPRFVLSALRGFTGLAKGRAIEQLFDAALWQMKVGETLIPFTTIVYDMDLGEVEFFGSARTPELRVGELVRIAIALPLFIESVEVRGHLYVDGGIIDVFPCGPFIEDGGFDHVIGLNFMLPPQLEAEDITGWEQSRMGVLKGSRQLEQGYHLEFARRSRCALGDSLIVVDPVDYSLLRGVSFYDLFIDRRRWPEIMRLGYEATRAALEPFRSRRRSPDRPSVATAASNGG
jgi:NTE family protein